MGNDLPTAEIAALLKKHGVETCSSMYEVCVPAKHLGAFLRFLRLADDVILAEIGEPDDFNWDEPVKRGE